MLGSLRCDCKQQLDAAFNAIAIEGRGIIIHLPQEGRGIGLANKVAAYALQDQGVDTVDANHQLGFADDYRTYGAVPRVLADLGINSVRLLTNNPYKVASLDVLGVKIAARLPLVAPTTVGNRKYLRTKAQRMAHILPAEAAEAAAAPTDAARFVNPATGKTHTWALGRASVVAAIAAVGRGELVVVTDDEGRENEGDLIMAAQLATPAALAFTVRYTGGVICIAMPGDRLDALNLPQMVPKNQDPKNTAFTLTVDCTVGTTTGISAIDRAQTMRMLADPMSTPDQFCRCAFSSVLDVDSGILRWR